MVNIAQAVIEDSEQILELMQSLARFEGYSDQFEVTKTELEQRCFVDKDFVVLTAKSKDRVVGILVYYFLPFSYDLTPWMMIKELYVAESFRALGIGKALFETATKKACEIGCGKIRWDVLASNHKAKAFYRSMGAKEENDWQLFVMDEQAIQAVALGPSNVQKQKEKLN